MFVYFSKRVAIPNTTLITCLSWNEEQGWLACGGKGGLLKVIKVDNTTAQKAGGLAMNQTLESHEADLSVVAWNHQYRKLTTSDVSGQIVVWTLHKGMWLEEMINNRNKSTVQDLSWNVDGTKVCIIYEDGAVIVGGVDGGRLWGKDLKVELSKVTWSPDDRYVLFGTRAGDVLLHDTTSGHYIGNIDITCEDRGVPLAGLSWCPAWAERDEPPAALALCYTSGKMQLMTSVNDDQPYAVDAGIPITCMAWSPLGTLLVTCGVATVASTNESEGEVSSVVIAQFFSADGDHLRSVRVAGKHCGGVAWEGDGLRVAIAVDASLYFANVRPEYKYAYFNNTMVYSYTRPDREEETVVFWNVRSNERSTRHIDGLLYIGSCKDACVVVNRPDDMKFCMLQLVNSIGSAVESRVVEMDPMLYAMNSAHFVMCEEENVFIWQFRDPTVVVDALEPVSMQASRASGNDRLMHIDDIVRADTASSTVGRVALTNDLCCSVCMNEDFLFIGRESGVVQMYSMDPMQLFSKFIIPVRPRMMAVNCNATRLAVVDLVGTLQLYHLDHGTLSLVPSKISPVPNFERKDVWSVRWADDEPEYLVLMEKSRMYIFNGLEPEEPVQSNASICTFHGLKVRALQIDEILQDPERPRKEHVLEFETCTLRDAREVMNTVSVRDAFLYVDEHPHKALWEMFAEHALSQLDFAHAELAVIRCRDYPTVQFVKRIRTLDDPQKQRAEIHAFYHRFDEAERIYKEMDRKDLALELRHNLGDWFRVVQLVQEGGGDEVMTMRTWENIGDAYADRQKWTKAAQYYTQCRHYRKLAHILFLIEDYEVLADLIPTIEHDRDLLLDIGRQFLSLGLGNEAACAFLAAGEVRLAIDGCVELHQWDRAVAIAEEYKLPDVAALLAQAAARLVDGDRLAEAIELFRKAGRHEEAARLLARLGQRAGVTDPLKAKKFYVLSALEIERYRAKRMTLSRNGAAAVDALLRAESGVGESGATVERTLDAAWRGAEAFHFFLLCQQHILQRNIVAALNTAMRLMNYDDLISPINSYSLIALTAYLAKNYGICSKAFMRLEVAEAMDACESEAGGGASGGGGGGVGRGQLQLIDMTTDLDVSCRTGVGAAAARGFALGASRGAAETRLDGTTTAFQLTNPAKGTLTATQFKYPTVSLKEPRRRFADLAIAIFTRHKPEDTSVDRVKCPKCDAFNKEWASACVRCQYVFGVCIASGRSIADEDFWQCNVCHHRIIDVEVDKFRNCPLCHTPTKMHTQRVSHRM